MGVNNVRFLRSTDGRPRIGGYLIVWGVRDKHGDTFSKDTDLFLEYWPMPRPLLYHHGRDEKAGTDDPRHIGQLVGYIDKLVKDDYGLWMEAWLEEQSDYYPRICEEIEAGILGLSSGAWPPLIRAENKTITHWPVVEGSLTTSPAEERTIGVDYVYEGAYVASVGVIDTWGNNPHLQALKAVISEERSATTAVPPVAEGVKPHGQNIRSPLKTESVMNPEDETPNEMMDEEEYTESDMPEEETRADDMEEEIAISTSSQRADSGEIAQIIQSLASVWNYELSPEALSASVEYVMQQTGQATGLASKSVKSANVVAVLSTNAKVISAVKSKMSNLRRNKPAASKNDIQAMLNLARGNTSAGQGGQPKGQPMGAGASSAVNMNKSHNSGGGISAMKTGLERYGWTHEDASYYIMAQRAMQNTISPIVNREIVGLMVDGTAKALKAGRLIVDDPRALKAIDGMSRNFGAFMKDDEVMNTGQIDYGAEWVPTVWATNIWDREVMPNVILPSLNTLDMPSNPFTQPVEDADPIVFSVPEAMDASQYSPTTGNPFTDSKIGSGNVQFDAKKLGLLVRFSSELNEDNAFALIPQYRKQSLRAMSDSIDYVLLNADDDEDDNINAFGTNGLAATNKARYGGGEGMLTTSVKSFPAQIVNFGGAFPTLTGIRQMFSKLGNQYRTQINNLQFAADGLSYQQLKNIPEFTTLDKAGAMATAQTGLIGFIDGVPVVVSGQISPSLANGYVSLASPASNTQGRLLLYFRPEMRVGYRRRVTLLSQVQIFADAYVMTATVRLALVIRDPTAIAVGINIGTGA